MRFSPALIAIASHFGNFSASCSRQNFPRAKDGVGEDILYTRKTKLRVLGYETHIVESRDFEIEMVQLQDEKRSFGIDDAIAYVVLYDAPKPFHIGDDLEATWAQVSTNAKQHLLLKQINSTLLHNQRPRSTGFALKSADLPIRYAASQKGATNIFYFFTKSEDAAVILQIKL